MKSVNHKQKKVCLVILFAILFFPALPRIILGWGCIIGWFETHQYFLKMAYSRLMNERTVKNLKNRGSFHFPEVEEILFHEGINRNLKGNGPDNEDNSSWSSHYYNPRTKRGGAPKAAADYYLKLKENLLKGQTTNAARDAAYMAHFIADLSCPYHVNGMPADEAYKAYEATRERWLVLDKNIAGDTGGTTYNWDGEFKVFKSMRNTEKEKKARDWFDPWYFNRHTKNVVTSTHVEWEGLCKPLVPSTFAPLYADGYIEVQSVKGNGTGASIEAFAQNIARDTRDHQVQLWKFTTPLKDQYEQIIRNIFTVWRASFSALHVEAKASPNSNVLEVNVTNLEDFETAQDVRIELRISGGKVIGESLKHLGQIDRHRSKRIRWEIEPARNEIPVQFKIIAEGKYAGCPDSGCTILEKSIRLVKKQTPSQQTQTEKTSSRSSTQSGREVATRKSSTQDNSLAEYRSLYPAYLQKFHEGQTVVLKANAVEIGNDTYHCAYEVYCLIKDGPRKGEKYKCVDFSRNFSLTQLKGMIPNMKKKLGR
jgi:hypothetical protein